MIQNANNQYTNNKEQFYVTEDVDAYTDNVDHLMDDLFGDVESTLHVDYAKQRLLKQKNGQGKQNKISAPYASVNSSSSDMVAISRIDAAERDMSMSKDTVSITTLNLADIALPPISKQDVLWIQPYIMRNPEPPSNVPPIDFVPAVQKSNLLERILLVAACSSALIAAIMWTINHGIWLGKQSVSVKQVNSQNISDSKSFGEEIRRMLAEVADKNRAIAATNLNGTIGSNIPLMSATLLSNMPLPVGANNPFGNVLQQPMYVPVYQPPSLNGTNVPSPLALPPVTSNNVLDISNAAPNARQNQNSPFIQSAVPVPSYTLIGVLDLGDRSTAMFDINGSVQSIGVGKGIGNAGWILSRVSQQEITLKRGKEIKTVFVGQKF